MEFTISESVTSLAQSIQRKLQSFQFTYCHLLVSTLATLLVVAVEAMECSVALFCLGVVATIANLI